MTLIYLTITNGQRRVTEIFSIFRLFIKNFQVHEAYEYNTLRDIFKKKNARHINSFTNFLIPTYVTIDV